MYCKKCGQELSDGASFCSSCGTEIKHEVRLNQNDTSDDTVENSLVIQINAGRLALNGELQLVSIFEFTGDEVDYRKYMRTTKGPVKETLSFRLKNIMSINYKKTLILGVMDYVRIAIAFVLILIGLVSLLLFALSLVGIAMVGLTYLKTRMTTMIISLNTGEKLKVYYNEKEDVEELARKLTE